MAFYNPTKNPFPFYKLEGEIWTNTKPLWFRNECKQNCCYKHKLTTGLNYFQLMIAPTISSLGDIASVDLRKVSDDQPLDFSIDFGLYSDTSSNRFLSIVLNAGNELLGDEYYISVETNEVFYYSEPFCISQIPKDTVTIEWSGKNKVGQMIYPPNFKHSVNVEAVISISESELEQEVESDGFGNETPTLQVLKQKMFVSFSVPNFIAQSLTAIPLHSKVNFINRYLGETPTELEKNNLNITVIATPESDNCFSFVEIVYNQNTTIKSGCDDEIRDLSIVEDGPGIVWSDDETMDDRSCNNIPCVADFKVTNHIESEDPTYIYQRRINGGSWTIILYQNGLENVTYSELEPAIVEYRAFFYQPGAPFIYTNTLKYTVS